MAEDRTPILIGAGQLVQRDVDPAVSLGPVEMMAETARRAAADAGAGARLLQAVDGIAVVNVIAWRYDNAPRLLAEQIGAQPSEEIYTTMSGSTPQRLVNDAAEKIAAGKARLVLLAGAEAIHTVTAARRADVRLPWRSGGEGSPTVVGDPRPGSNDHEIAHGLRTPIEVYPLFETAVRARAGRTVEAHMAHLGELCSRMSAVAAANPYAWFRRRRSAAEIATPTAENRFVGFPYTKYMNAIIHVDQSAAVLLTSVGAARELGIAPDRWVYPWASADATERWCVSERRDYHSAPAYRTAARRALESTGVSIDDLRYFDLYSCFPSAVQIARDMLGIAPGDPRDLTVSGGLPYHGGPGSNYAMHAIATMMTKLRGTTDGVGLVSALGWYLTMHAIGLYGATRPRRPWRRVQCDDDATDGSGAPGLAREPVGAATVETCTVMHARDGAPVRGLVIGRLEDGRRFLANTAEDRGVLEALMSDDIVGRRGRVEPIDGKNRFEPL